MAKLKWTGTTRQSLNQSQSPSTILAGQIPTRLDGLTSCLPKALYWTLLNSE